MRTTANNTSFTQKLISMFVAVSLLLGSVALVGCSGKKDEQDNCYGEDMPVVNED